MAVVKEKTIKELCRRVAATHMLDKLDDDTVVAYQDLIGHATMEENKELSNDSALMETFYWIYGAAYGTVAAIKFYMQNSNKVENILAERDTYKADYEGLKETKRLLGEQLETAKRIQRHYVTSYMRLSKRLMTHLKGSRQKMLK